MRSTNRREFLRTLSGAGTLALLGLSGCRQVEDGLATLALGPQDGPLAVPRSSTIDATAHLLNRLSFGPRPGDRAELEGLGADAWIARQLAPESIDDRRCDWRIASIEPLGDARGEHYEYSPEEMLFAIGQSRLLRAVHSSRQLLEVMVECWSDHLNIVAGKGDCRWIRLADELEALRPHALGSFRDLIRASATSPAMLIYLDGHDNKVERPGDHPNENYARELLELHTLGVDGGYTQGDVLEAARCLSGWTYGHDFWRGRVSRVAFDPARHDDGAKEVLGVGIPAGGGADDIERLLDVVCFHPSTARHVARRLCRTFIDDAPPAAAIDAGAKAFTESRGHIPTVLAALFATEAFRSSPGTLLKRPFRFVASALRATAATTDGGAALLDALRRMGHGPSEYPTPDGYPLEPEPWYGTLFWRWNFAADLANGAVDGTEVELDALVTSAGGPEAALAHVLGRQPSPREREVILGTTRPLALALASPAFQRH
jgi:uncharacterized protein (DUF1800 family)